MINLMDYYLGKLQHPYIEDQNIYAAFRNLGSGPIKMLA